MVHTLKVVWTSDSGENEIRRLTVHNDVLNRYDLLAEKIVKLFPQLNGQNFQLGWKDFEGDFIVMSSDEELAQAVANAVDNELIKIFVTTKMAKNGDHKPQSLAVHPHVVCDGCNGSVSGYRYKCLECVDYDLCESCHGEDKHPGHDMLKFCRPVGESHNWMFPGWRRMCQSMFGRHPFGGRCGRKFGPKSAEETDKKEKQQGNNPGSPHAEFLRNIGKSVAFFLDPLGIDVDVMVSESDPDNSNSGNSRKGAEAQTEEKEPKDLAEEKIESDKDTSVDATPASENKDEQTANVAPTQNESSPTESPQGARPRNYGIFQRKVYTRDDNPEDSEDESTQDKEASPENFSGHDDWTVVNNVPKDNKNGGIDSSVADMKVSYPELPEEKMPSEISAMKGDVHPDPKVANALSKMCAMGFTNDGGWLTRLLETKNGNINDVLDALYPHRH